jgi:asparagine synthase (glutamine-hydrolysing)
MGSHGAQGGDWLMCGLIAAFADSTPLEPAILRAMQQMHRRGPDGEGLWQDSGVCLGHRRLAILDLDQRAAQPMHSACGRYVIVFNGEIYNFRDLRDDLIRQGVAFRTTSDTEVILALFAAEGAAMLPKLHGMFALVIWDTVTRRAFAARDPYGIKPLYVATTADGVLLASQVKALLATGLVSREPDPRGQAGFWLLGSVPEPQTWYRHIKAIPAGHCAWIQEGRITEPTCWFDIGKIWREAPAVRPFDDFVRAQVRAALRESVARHLVADVPVGVFLSGGIDSGALAGLMVQAGAQQLEGVTIAFDEFAGNHQDEAPSATAIVAHYGIRHHVRRVTRDEFLADLPRILDAMDQPSIDGINTWYASKAVAELGLKVVVSGVGGDELFQGYESFQQLPRMVDSWSVLSRLPGMQAVGKLAGALQARRSGNARWRHAAEWARTIGGAWWLRRSLYAPEDLPGLMGKDLAAEVLQGFDASNWVETMSGALPSDGKLALGQIESTTYLRNQLLRDSDWASMDHSVELRTPLVDAHLLASLQSALPSFSHHPGKQLLAEAPEHPLPHYIIERRKSGFGIPVGRWLAAESQPSTPALDSRAWANRVAATYDTGCAG